MAASTEQSGGFNWAAAFEEAVSILKILMNKLIFLLIMFFLFSAIQHFKDFSNSLHIF